METNPPPGVGPADHLLGVLFHAINGFAAAVEFMDRHGLNIADAVELSRLELQLRDE